MLVRWLAGLLAVGTLVVACAEPAPARKKAAVCDPATTDCGPTSGPRKEQSDGTLKTTTGAPLEAPDAKSKKETAPTSATPPAGGEETEPVADPDPIPFPPLDLDPPDLPAVGPKCSQLTDCCANLRTAGITGSANQCDETAAKNDEFSCDIANTLYKTPDDFYDPVCF